MVVVGLRISGDRLPLPYMPTCHVQGLYIFLFNMILPYTIYVLQEASGPQVTQRVVRVFENS